MKNIENYQLWTAMVTPFNEDKSIDFKSLENLLLMQEKAGNAVLLLGSTGEALALDEEEKKEIIMFACSLNLKIPFMVGVQGFNLKKTLEWMNFCENFPIDAFLAVTPIYAKPGVHGQLEWFSELLNNCSKPCMLYNIPGRAACPLSIEAVKELKDHPNFWSIKESGGSLESFLKFKEELPGVKLFSGDDPMLHPFFENGAVGQVSASANMWPEIVKEQVLAAIEQGKKCPFWQEACEKVFTSVNPIPVKAILFEKGWIKTPLLRPPLSHLDLTNKEELLQITLQNFRVCN